MKQLRAEQRLMKEQGAAYRGHFFKKKKDVIYLAMRHLPRERHTLEGLQALCLEHPQFQPHAAELDEMLGNKRTRHRV